MNIFSLFLLLGCEDIDSTVEDDVVQTEKKQEVVNKVDQGELIHGQLLDGRRDIAKEKLLKGEIESPDKNGLHIFYYCSQDDEPELCFGDFKESKGKENIPLYQSILNMHDKKWSKAKIYADSIEDEQLRNGIGALALVENALQDNSSSLNIDATPQYHQNLIDAFRSTDVEAQLAPLKESPWYYQLIAAKIAHEKSQNDLALTFLNNIIADSKNPLAQVEALRTRSQIGKIGLSLENLKDAVKIFKTSADVSSLVFISENLSLQARGLGETRQIYQWFEKNYNRKAIEKEKTFSSELLIFWAVSDLLGYHKQSEGIFTKLKELSGKRDNSILFSHFTFTQVYHALNTGNIEKMKALSEKSEGEEKTLISVLSKVLSSEKATGADSAIAYLPVRQYVILGLDLCKYNSDIGKRLLPNIIKTAQDYALPTFEIEASLLLEQIYRFEGSTEGLKLLKNLQSKYPNEALSAEIAVRTYLFNKDFNGLSASSNTYLKFWQAMLNPIGTPQFPTMKIPKLEQDGEKKKKDIKKKEPPAVEEQKEKEPSVVENTENKGESKDPLQEAQKENVKKEDVKKEDTKKEDPQDMTDNASIEYEDGVPAVFENLHQLYLLKFALKTKRVPSEPLNQFWQRSVFHRQGLLSLGTVLDGSQGMSLDKYVFEHVNNVDPLTVSSLFILQEADRRRLHIQNDAATSRNFLFGMKEEQRLSLMEATHRTSISLLEHYIGAAFPHDDFANLKSVEEELYKKAKDSEEKSIWQKLTTNGSVDVTSLRDVFGKNAILSYNFYNGRIIGISLSPTKAAIRDLGSQSSILSLVNKHIAQLSEGQSNPDIYKPRSPKHKLANTLRQILIEPFKGELYGFGRYMVIAPEKLLHFSFTTFPDQQDGMRFLGEKRTITASTGLEEILENSSQFGSYEPDMFAMSRLGKIEDQLAAGLQPSESVPIQQVSIHFRPDSRQILKNEEVTLEKYRSIAHGARYLYLSDMPTSPDGGFEFQDGTLTLSEIQQSHLAAQVVFISPTAPIDIQVKRARAFLNAGVRSVMINTLPIDAQNERIMLDALFESLNRDDTLAQALSNARSSYIKESSKKGGEVSFVSNPGVWGTFHLFGQP